MKNAHHLKSIGITVSLPVKRSFPLTMLIVRHACKSLGVRI